MRGDVADVAELDRRSGPEGSAVFSACGRYRYELTRRLGEGQRLFEVGGALRGAVRWVLLNPSSADEAVLDPTLTRCWAFSRTWGFAAMIVHNLFAWRSSDPRAMAAAARKGADVVGPANDAFLAGFEEAELTVVGWGGFALAASRARRVAELLCGGSTYCLGRNLDGSPRHPLYLASSTRLEPYTFVDADGQATLAASRGR